MNKQEIETTNGKCDCGNTLFFRHKNEWFCGECYIDLSEQLENARDDRTEALFNERNIAHKLSIALEALEWIGNETDLQHCIDEAKEALTKIRGEGSGRG